MNIQRKMCARFFKALQKELDAARSRFSENGEGGVDSFRLSSR